MSSSASGNDLGAAGARIASAEVVRPFLGQPRSGDATIVRADGDTVLVAIIDALGHGAEANETAVVVERLVREAVGDDPVQLLVDVHARAEGTRGAAVGVAFIDLREARLRYAGVGNTVLRRLSPRPARLASQDGMIGGRMRTPMGQVLELRDGDVILMHTDGVSSTFADEACADLRTASPQVVASTVVHRFGKRHDDAACIAVRYEATRARGAGA